MHIHVHQHRYCTVTRLSDDSQMTVRRQSQSGRQTRQWVAVCSSPKTACRERTVTSTFFHTQEEKKKIPLDVGPTDLFPKKQQKNSFLSHTSKNNLQQRTTNQQGRTTNQPTNQRETKTKQNKTKQTMRTDVGSIGIIWMFLTTMRFGIVSFMHGTVVVDAFVVPKKTPFLTTTKIPPSTVSLFTKQPSSSSSSYFTSTGWDSFEKMKRITDMPSGEGQRKFRRTVYSHDDWKKHRSQDRFIFYLLAIFNSGVYKNLGREVFMVSLVAVFVCIYNAIVGGYIDWNGISQDAIIQNQFFPKLGLPLASFTLTSPSLGLLLGTYILYIRIIYIYVCVYVLLFLFDLCCGVAFDMTPLYRSIYVYIY